MDNVELDQAVLQYNAKYYEEQAAAALRTGSVENVLSPGFILKTSTKLPKVEPMQNAQPKQSADQLVREIEAALKGKSFEVEVREETLKIGKSEYKTPAYAFKKADQVMSELRALAKTDNIRVFFPHSMGTNDYVEGRVNFIFDAKGRFQRCFKG